MPTKSTRAFRTISEASDELGLKPHVLRFWEAKFPELSPMTRGGGRRFYRPEDILFLHGLRILLHDEKHKIKDVQKLIKMRGAHSVIELGQSAVNERPSKPIEQRKQVPDRIVPVIQSSQPASAISPVLAPMPAPMPAAVVEPVIVPFTPKAEPAAIAAAPIPAPKPEPETPKVSAEDKKDLENAMDRLSALRSRWQKFT